MADKSRFKRYNSFSSQFSIYAKPYGKIKIVFFSSGCIREKKQSFKFENIIKLDI